jgi:hypothetical protein
VPRVASFRACALPVAALLLGSACETGVRAGEIDCQRRLVEGTSDIRVEGGSALAPAFAGVRDRLTHMPREGCTEEQILRADLTARAAGRIVELAERIGDLGRVLEQAPELRTNENFLELQSEIEGFELRRRALRETLDRMAAE